LKLKSTAPSEVIDTAHEVMLRPFQWGTADCATSVAAVFLRLRGHDFMQGLRGTYSTEAEAPGLIREALARAQAQGFTEVTDYRPADVGLVNLHGLYLMAICAGEFWIMKSKDGMMFRRTAARAWRL
jgi:hypothetical protein